MRNLFLVNFNQLARAIIAAMVLLAPISPALAVAPFMPPPINLALVPGVGVVTLSWNPGANGTGNEEAYDIQQSTDGQNFVDIGVVFNTGQNSYSRAVSGLAYDTEYWFKVAGYQPPGTYSDWVVAGSVSTLIENPAPPTASGPTNSTLNLSFSAPANNPATVKYGFYNMTLGSYLKEDGSAANQENVFLAAPNDPRWTNFKAIGLSPNTAYRFEVKAQGANTESWSGDSAAVRTLANPPTNLQATAASATSVTVSWGGDAVTSYNVKNTSTGAESGWRTGTSYAFTNLTCNTNYNFTVQSRNSDNVAGAAVAVSGTTAACPAEPPPVQPTLTSVSAAANSNTSITVSWNGTASNYFVQNATDATNSGWISGNSYTFNNLICNTTYNFTVQGRNTGGTLTAQLSVTAQTKACGSPPPSATTTTPPRFPLPATCPATLAPGSMIKVRGKPPIYVLNAQFQVLHFPSGDEFKSWNADDKYGGYILVEESCFDDLPLPSIFPVGVNYRPGSYVVKKSSSDQLYAVLPNDSLAKITERAARDLYGANFIPKVIADISWLNYIKRGVDITEAKAHVGMLVRQNAKNWYIEPHFSTGRLWLREVTAAGFTANRFKSIFIRTVPAIAVADYPVGAPITTDESRISNRIYIYVQPPT
ncbi:MAG: fibronectin type III domain-containing protein [Candidatus Magasanikbacteria bacterium]|nr:fibronectin type III domain-containing protein [Candidatus Magasanikbacteria bacterium]